MVQSKGQMEDDITKAIINWELEYLGRGPTEAKTDILRNMIIVTLKGVISQAEHHLSRNKDGMILLKRLRQQLIEQGRSELEEIIFRVAQRRVVTLHTDVSTKTGERIFLFRLDQEL